MNKKYLSQNWLSDIDSLEAMIRAGEVMRDDVVLEIGPGPGTLTELLTQRAKHVIAVEFDEVLAENLHRIVPAINLEVHHADILNFDFSDLHDFKVVANIPYHITAKIIQRFVTSKNPPSLLALLVQKEVAQRVVATPGAMSVLAVSVQLYADVEALEVVPAELFTPPPKVDSQILQIRMRDEPRFDVNETLFFRLVKAGFGERRKKLVNSLAGGLQLQKKEVEKLLVSSKIELSSRAQELSIESWYDLYTNYATHSQR